MIGILIIARLGSERLPFKHLIEYGEKTFISHLVNRIGYTLEAEIEAGSCCIIIATGDPVVNKEFSELAFDFPVHVYFGDNENVPRRQVECARELGLDAIISVDGDDLLISPEALRDCFQYLASGGSMVRSSGLPLGMNVMGYSAAYLTERLKKLSAIKVLETGWGRIFEKSDIHEISYKVAEDGELLRFTLDYQEDADFFKKVFLSLGPEIWTAGFQKILDTVFLHEYFRINGFLNLEYWKNFNSGVQKEQDTN